MAPFDVVIRTVPLQTRQPEVFFITNERLEEAGGIPAAGPLPIGPELIIEVLSASETPRTLGAKLEDFASVGVREAWLVSPESETVQVYRLAPEWIEPAAVYIYGQTLTSEAIPDLSIALADTFDE
jgi:Uma2 family endonuclease